MYGTKVIKFNESASKKANVAQDTFFDFTDVSSSFLTFKRSAWKRDFLIY